LLLLCPISNKTGGDLALTLVVELPVVDVPLAVYGVDGNLEIKVGFALYVDGVDGTVDDNVDDSVFVCSVDCDCDISL